MVQRIESITQHLAKRNLSNQPGTVNYQGELFSVQSGPTLSGETDISACLQNIRESLGFGANISFQYLELSSTLIPYSSPIRTEQLLIQSDPRVIISLFLDNTLADTNKYCDPEYIDLEYSMVAEEEDLGKIEETLQKGVNPFDKDDRFFTDFCSIRNDKTDMTLSARTDQFYIDPSVKCRQLEGQTCTVIDYDTKGSFKCKCVGRRGQLAAVGDNLVVVLTKSNAKLTRCFSRIMNTSLFHSSGFIFTVGMLLIFYILQNLSEWYRLQQIEKGNITEYLVSSLLLLDNAKIKAEKYLQTLINLRQNSDLSEDQSICSSEISVEELSDKQVSSKQASSQASLEEFDQNQAYLRENFKKLDEIVPTEMDYRNFSFEEAILVDKRSFWSIFCFNAKIRHKYISTFKHPCLFEPLHFKLFLLMTSINLELAINALFYFEYLIDLRASATETVFW